MVRYKLFKNNKKILTTIFFQLSFISLPSRNVFIDLLFISRSDLNLNISSYACFKAVITTTISSGLKKII